jgi:Periplasmic binding protein
MASTDGRRLLRSWRRFQRRPIGVRVATVVIVVVVIAGIAVAASSSSSSKNPTAATLPPSAAQTALDQASTSSVGVTASTITVAFPVSNLDALSSTLGFAGDVEYSEQQKAINLFVSNVNQSGGINGRKIKADIVNIDPTNENDMRAVCKDFTEGSGAVFAVLDGIGSWTGTDQLCVTQVGHTPMISQWSTVPNWTEEGSPYLWWTGPNQAQVLEATVDWAFHKGLIGPNKELGVVAGDRPSDQLALNDYLLPDLARIHVKSLVEPMPAEPSEFGESSSAAPLIVEKLHEAGIDTVLPLIPFNAMFPTLQAETSQEYFPHLLLSDYEYSIQSALGVLQVFPKALNGQDGITTETLGGIDDDRPYSEGGYDPGDRQCWDIWHKAYPEIPKGNQSDFMEEQGPVQAWCQEIRLFTDAAKMAGKDLNRRTFVEAMSKISDFPGGYSPVLSYRPGTFAGPTQYRVVKLYINIPPTAECKMPKNHIPQTVCWVIQQNWQPLPSGTA